MVPVETCVTPPLVADRSTVAPDRICPAFSAMPPAPAANVSPVVAPTLPVAVMVSLFSEMFVAVSLPAAVRSPVSTSVKLPLVTANEPTSIDGVLRAGQIDRALHARTAGQRRRRGDGAGRDLGHAAVGRRQINRRARQDMAGIQRDAAGAGGQCQVVVAPTLPVAVIVSLFSVMLVAVSLPATPRLPVETSVKSPLVDRDGRNRADRVRRAGQIDRAGDAGRALQRAGTKRDVRAGRHARATW